MPETQQHGLGRVVIEDPRDEAFPMQSILPRETPGRTYRYWWPGGWWGDQGSTPQCVAYSWLHWLHDGPVTHERKPPFVPPVNLYKDAQAVDQWPGTNYDGTSVRAGAKILQSLGVIESYTWAWDLDTMIHALLTTGPVVVGTWWYTDMFYPDDKGWLKVGGSRSGGHAYLLNGVNVEQEKLRLKNSWGRGWGDNGDAWISFKDMARLIREQGEVCLAIEKRLAA